MTLKADQKEGLVVTVIQSRNNDRTTKGAGYHVITEATRRNIGVLPVPMDLALAQVAFFGQTVKLVGAALVRDIHDPAPRLSVFGWKRGGKHLDLFDVLLDGRQEPIGLNRAAHRFHAGNSLHGRHKRARTLP